MPRKARSEISEEDLSNWRLIERFKASLARVSDRVELAGSFEDKRRKLTHEDYLSLFLFGLLNPVVRTMRGLCAASDIERVQDEICSRSVSLGSFSEAQDVLDLTLLEEVFKDLLQSAPGAGDGCPDNADFSKLKVLIQDGTLWQALPRMQWAHWRTQHKRQSAVKLHLTFNLFDQKPAKAMVTEGIYPERTAWRQMWEKGATYVGDRAYGHGVKIFDELREAQCSYVLRLLETSPINVVKEIAVSKKEEAGGILRHAIVTLGSDKRYECRPMRAVWVQTPKEIVVLATNLDPNEFSAEMISSLYRKRWQVELFFRWIKCILGCRHWLAESRQGVTIQVYLALIAALLLQGRTGQRPNKRIMELIQFYAMGIASCQDLERGLERELARIAAQNAKKKA